MNISTNIIVAAYTAALSAYYFLFNFVRIRQFHAGERKLIVGLRRNFPRCRGPDKPRAAVKPFAEELLFGSRVKPDTLALDREKPFGRHTSGLISRLYLLSLFLLYYTFSLYLFFDSSILLSIFLFHNNLLSVNISSIIIILLNTNCYIILYYSILSVQFIRAYLDSLPSRP